MEGERCWRLRLIRFFLLLFLFFFFFRLPFWWRRCRCRYRDRRRWWERRRVIRITRARTRNRSRIRLLPRGLAIRRSSVTWRQIRISRRRRIVCIRCRWIRIRIIARWGRRGCGGHHSWRQVRLFSRIRSKRRRGIRVWWHVIRIIGVRGRISIWHRVWVWWTGHRRYK